jgi:hypothetical protein
MRRPRNRLWLAVIGTLALVALSVPSSLHGCAMSAAVDVAGAPDAPDESAHHHGSHHADASPTQPDAPAGDSTCECVDCCITNTGAPLPPVFAVHVPATVDVATAAGIDPGAAVRSRTERLLPFANGPPLS